MTNDEFEELQSEAGDLGCQLDEEDTTLLSGDLVNGKLV